LSLLWVCTRFDSSFSFCISFPLPCRVFLLAVLPLFGPPLPLPPRAFFPPLTPLAFIFFVSLACPSQRPYSRVPPFFNYICPCNRLFPLVSPNVGPWPPPCYSVFYPRAPSPSFFFSFLISPRHSFPFPSVDMACLQCSPVFPAPVGQRCYFFLRNSSSPFLLSNRVCGGCPIPKYSRPPLTPQLLRHFDFGPSPAFILLFTTNWRPPARLSLEKSSFPVMGTNLSRTPPPFSVQDPLGL